MAGKEEAIKSKNNPNDVRIKGGEEGIGKSNETDTGSVTNLPGTGSGAGTDNPNASPQGGSGTSTSGSESGEKASP